MSDTPTFYEDNVTEDVRVVTHYDVTSNRWTTTVMGGPIDGWSMTYRAEDDPAVQRKKAIAAAQDAADV